MKNMFDVRMISMNELKRVNGISISEKFNRNINFPLFYKLFKKAMKVRGMWHGNKNTHALLVPLMIHEHKGGEVCEKHMRCEIYTDGCVNEILTIDLPFKVLNSLVPV